MEKGKEKKGAFGRLGKLFSRSRTLEAPEEPQQEDSQQGSGGGSAGAGGVRRSRSDVGPPPALLPPEEVESNARYPPGSKRRSFPGWKQRRPRSSHDSGSTASGGSRSPPPDTASLATGDRSFEISDEDHSIQDMAVFPEPGEETQIFNFNMENSSVSSNSPAKSEKSRAQSSDTSKKETTKKPVLGKFGNLFASNKKRSSKNNPTSPTSPNGAKTVSPSKDLASSKSPEKELFKDKTKSQGSVIPDSRGQNQTGTKSSPAETASSSPRKKVNLNQAPKENVSGKGSQKWTNGNKGGNPTGQSLNPEGESQPLIAELEKESDSKQAANGLSPSPESYSHPPSLSNPPPPPEDASSGDSLQGVKAFLNGADAQDLSEKDATLLPNLPTEQHPAPGFEESEKNERTLQLSGEEVILGKEVDNNSIKASNSKKTVSSVTNIAELHLGNSEIRKAKQVFRVSIGNKGCEQENPTPSNSGETEESMNPINSLPNENPGNASVKQTQAVLEKLPMAQEPAKDAKESPNNPSESVSPAKYLTVDIYLTKTVESSGNTLVPSTPKEGSCDAELVEMRSNSNKKSGKKRRSFRFNASQNDDKSTAEPAAPEEAVIDSVAPSEGLTEKAAAPLESSAKSTQHAPEPGTASPGKQEPRAATNLKVSPRGESDKSKQQLPPASLSKRKPGRESQPASSVPASPTARKSQPRDPLLKSQLITENCQPAGSVSTTKGAAAGDKATPLGSASGICGDSSSAPQAEITGGSPGLLQPADNSAESRKFQRENSTGKKATLHIEGGRACRREHEKSTATYVDALKHKTSSVIVPKSTVTTKLNIPAKPKNVDLNLKTQRVDSLEIVEDTAIEQPINRGNTANKISLFENKGTNQSHRQIDFYATKSIPLTKKYVGRAKLKFGKQAKETEQVDDNSTNRQYSRQKSQENDQPIEKIPPEIKEKFEKAMELETVSKAEAGKSILPKKKGKSVGPQLTQSTKPNLQADAMNLDVADSEAGNVDKDSMLPKAASLHQQVNELQQGNGTKGIVMDSKPQESTSPPVKSETKCDKTTTLTVQDKDSSPVIALSAEGDPPPINVTTESSDVSTTEHVFTPRETCVEIVENIAKPQDPKNSTKSPTRKADRSIGNKNDRQKKKQPSETETSALQEHVHFQQPMESRENSKTEEDMVDAPVVDRVNASEVVTSTCGAEHSQLKLGAEVSNGEKISRLGMQNETPVNFIESLTEHQSRSNENISPKLEANISVAEEVAGGLRINPTSEMEQSNLQKISDSPKQAECGVPVKQNTNSSEQVHKLGRSVTEKSFSQLDRSNVEGSTENSAQAQAPPLTDMQEFAVHSKEIEKKVVHPSVLEHRGSKANENGGNETVDTDCFSQSTPIATSKSTNIELSENTELLNISVTQQEKRSQDAVSPQQSFVDLQQAEVNIPTAALLSPEERALSQATSTGETSPVMCAVTSNTSDIEHTENGGLLALHPHESEDLHGVLSSEENIVTVKNGETEGTLQKEGVVEKYLPCPIDTENKFLLLEPTGHSDSLAVSMHHLETVSDVQQSEESTVTFKSGKNEEVSSHVLPVRPGEKHLPTPKDPESKLFPPGAASTHHIPVNDTHLPVLVPALHHINSDTLEKQKVQLISSQTDAQENYSLQNGSVVLKQESPEEEKIDTTPQNAEPPTTTMQTLPDVGIAQHVQPSKEGKQIVYGQSSFFSEFAKKTELPDAEVYLSDYQTDAQNLEYKTQDGVSHVASVSPYIYQNMSAEKQNVSSKTSESMTSEVFTTNMPYSNGGFENGITFDQNGMINVRCPSMVFNVSPASDDSSLDSSAEMERFTEIIRKLDSPISVPQKRKKQRVPRSPQPSFGLPPIHEDYLEKIFDSNIFKFGLGKERPKDLAPALMLKMQSTETATRVRPKRASAEQSMLLKSLRSSSRDVSLPSEEAEGKENTDVTDLEIKRSRFEKSTIFSNLKSPLITTSKENMFSPSVTSIDTITTSFATSQNDSNFASPKSFDAHTSSKTLQMSEVAQNSIPDQGPGPCKDPSSDHSRNCEPNFSNPSSLAPLKVPSYMEKYLKTDDEKQEQNLLSVFPLLENGCTDLPKTDLEFAATFNDRKNISGPLESTPKTQLGKFPSTDEEFSNRFKPNHSENNPAIPAPNVEPFIGNGQEKINPRPGKLVIFGEPNFCGTTIEIFADVPDCTSWELSPVISIKIVRGCWLLYEKPNFEGLSIPLEEGEMELTNLWGEEIIEEKGVPPTVIGSLRQVVKDYRICQIDLFTEADGLGLVTSYFDDTEEVQVYDRLQKTCSIKVHWGVWLIYEDSGFQGVPFILEPGEYSNLAFWDTHEAYIGSMRPLKMGGRKVEIPNEPKIFVYEKAFFEGKELELDGEVFRLDEELCKSGEDLSGEEQSPSFTTVGSMRVFGGVWVGYEKPGFEGHQYLLEEGDYPQWTDWAGYNDQLQSFRPILADFSTSHMIMYTDKDFGEKGSNINILGIISNMEDTGYGVKTQSINVLSGVWVAYEYADFTGEQYVLEKGMYSSFEDWGAKNLKISSVQPIGLDSIGCPVGKFKVLLFSEPEFQGSIQTFEENTKQIDDSFMAKSCKVLAGSWVAFDGEDFSGHQYILEEGTYPDLCSMGCQLNTSFRSLHIIDYEFSEPNAVLYGKQHYKGKKIEFTAETVNLQCLGYTSRVSSVEVLGGLWVIYEYSNYRGRQILLLPDKIPDWYAISGWHTIGSLRPLIQKRVYFRIRNKATGMFVSTNGNLDDLKLLRLQVTEDTGAEDQIWAYHEGSLKCRIAEDCCVAISGSLVTAGSKLGLSLEEKNDNQYWSISPEGKIHSRMKPNLVLDIKGGTQYDQHHIILNTISEGKQTQCWELLVL